MRYWRFVLCGLGAILAGLVAGLFSTSIVFGFDVTTFVLIAGSYMIWELGKHGGEAGHLTSDKDSEEGRYAGGYAGFHDGGGGGLG